MARIALVTDKLSPAAQRLMVGGFRAKLTSRMIADQIARETGEQVAERTVSRRASDWRKEQRRRESVRENVQAMVAAMKAENLQASEMIQALAIDALMADPEAWSQSDPIKVQRQNLQAEKLKQSRESMELRRRQIELEQQKFDLMRERERKAAAETEALAEKAGRGEQITEADVRKIRDIYGLN